MKNNNSSQDNQSQVLYNRILLAIDVHARYFQVARQLDACPQPSQRMDPDRFTEFARAQLKLAKAVYAVYEAGPFGYHLARQLRDMGIECYVMRPQKLDPYQRRVCTDKTDAREMLADLDRYVRGNPRALCVVQIPTPQQELRRALSRQRDALQKDRLRLAARGRCLLLTQGVRVGNYWWKPQFWWMRLRKKLAPELVAILEAYRALIEAIQEQIQPLEKAIRAAAPQTLPLGMGALTFEILLREILRWERFSNRRQVGSFTGLCGGVSSSGNYHVDLPATKHGNPRVRGLLIELAWRMVFYQRAYRPVVKWKSVLEDGRKRARRKQAIVAIGRQLAVDIWKWQTGRAKPEQLGWVMTPAII